ncbi:hypothetical protein NUW58_g4373 [Xylaria curta]|uniref:Uncharacterized protein n=1 Tax=Xylaria curta TaxID=42375 RepID=A0ACC1P9D0_9PEZI|nr:hypothetical protein NUW58_g4373 [Xylaria curta]
MPLTAVFDVVGSLSWTQLALGATSFTILWFLVTSTVAWYKLRHIPGPFFASFSNIWLVWTAYSGLSHLIIDAEQKKHGSVLRTGPADVAIFDPETLMRINSARSPYTRGMWYRSARVDYRADSVLTELDIGAHGKRKSKLASAFSGKNVARLESKVDEWIAALIAKIHTNIASGRETMDIGKLVQYFQVDLISDIQLGEPWGDLEGNKDAFGFLKMSDNFLPAMQSFAALPLARAIYTSPWFMRLFGPKPTDTSGLGLFIGIIEKEVNRRFGSNIEKPSESRDLLDIWIDHGLTPDECQLDLSLLVPAGTETTASMIRGTLLLLGSSPVPYRKLKQELRDAIAAGRISNPVTNDEAKRLEYLQAVISEGFRLMVPISFGFPKVVPPSGDTICGKFIPGGTNVYPNYHGMMRNKEVFGHDADIFRPERFLDDEHKAAYMRKVTDLAFGAGRFMCLGKALALIEMNKIFVELLRNFDIQTASPERPWQRTGYTTWIIDNFLTRVTEDTTMR